MFAPSQHWRHSPSTSLVTRLKGIDVGEDTGMPVSTSYDVPLKFTSEIEKVIVELK